VAGFVTALHKDLRMGIKDAAQLETAPKLRRLRADEVP
jgi:CPA2 family monovalent cation:H+ antiporter-2